MSKLKHKKDSKSRLLEILEEDAEIILNSQKPRFELDRRIDSSIPKDNEKLWKFLRDNPHFYSIRYKDTGGFILPIGFIIRMLAWDDLEETATIWLDNKFDEKIGFRD